MFCHKKIEAMGCFSMCFRVRDRKRRNVHVNDSSASPSRCRDKNSPLASRLQKPVVENQAPTTQLFEDQRKPENLHRRIGINPRWAQKLVAPAEFPDVQKPHDYSDNVENAQKKSISSVKKDPLEEVNELALELADLARTIEEEAKDVKMFGNEVKSLRSCRTLTPISGNEMIAVSEQCLQTVGCGVNRAVSSKKTISMYSEKSIISDSQSSIQEVTKPTLTEIKVSDKEDVPSKPWQNMEDSYQPCQSTNRQDQNGACAKPVGKRVTFDLTTESPSSSFDSENIGHTENSYDSISDASVSLNSYTEEEEEEEEEEDEEEESVVSENSQSYSCSYTGSEVTISDVCHSGHSASPDSGDNSITRTGSSSGIVENEGESEGVTSNASKTSLSAVQRQPRYHNYESSDEDYDSLSDSEDSLASVDLEEMDSTQTAKQFEAINGVNQSPPLVKSNYSPQPSPMKLVDDAKPTWSKCANVLENAAVNNNARIRSQYVYPVLNPVENLSQWKALKKDSKTDAFGNSKEFYEDNKVWAEYMGMPENQFRIEMRTKSSPSKKQRVEGVPKFSYASSIPASVSATKENIHLATVVEQKKSDKILEVKEESSQRRNLIPQSPEPVFKEPKIPASQNRTNSNAMPGEAQRSDVVYVDASLSHWLKPTEPVDNGYRVLSSQKGGKENLAKGGELSSRQNIMESGIDRQWNSQRSPNQQVATIHASPLPESLSPPSADCRPVLAVPGMQNLEAVMEKQSSPLRSPSRSNDERPILGALSIEHIQEITRSQLSPRRSPSSKDLDDRPILGAVASHWSDKQTISPSKREDGKGGIANPKNRYTEDQKVSWDTTPFEVRLERALSNGVGYQRHATNISS